MYAAIVRSRVRRGFGLLAAGRLDELVGQFAPDAILAFPGDHAMSGEYRGPARIRAWFEETRRIFPDFRVEPRRILVSGGPWHTRVATEFDVLATFPDGSPYRNHGVQLLDLRWGRIYEDRLFEDTQVVAEALERLAAAGHAAATP